MTGREKSGLKTEKEVRNRLKNAPAILSSYMEYQTDMQPTTLKTYVNHLIRFSLFLKENEVSIEEPEQIRPTDIAAWIRSIEYTEKNGNQHKTSSSYRVTAWSSVNSFFAFCLANGYVKENTCEKTKRPKSNDPLHKDDYLTLNQMQELSTRTKVGLQNVSEYQKEINERFLTRDHLIITLFLSLGIRASALKDIDVSDIDMENGYVYLIEKGEKHRRLKLHEKALTAVRNYLPDRETLLKGKEDTALFISWQGKRCTYETINNVVKKYTKDALSAQKSCHKLRHSFCSAAYEAQHDVEVCRELMGHKNISTTMRYIGTDFDRKSEEIGDYIAVAL